ncbi:MAG: hypothetical protein GXX85_00820 [Ignavibacteria bacterium]|nr:hypothetical protein [Ignavibacteria bacterium]
MKEFEHDKTKDIIPRILGGLSIPVGVLIIFLWILSIPLIFIPQFNPWKILYSALFDATVYTVAAFVDVSNNGIHNVIKMLFSKNIEAVKIKHSKFLMKSDDSK